MCNLQGWEIDEVGQSQQKLRFGKLSGNKNDVATVESTTGLNVQFYLLVVGMASNGAC